jgi:uncharacterized protein YndB with AHSA1/START domain
MVMSELATIDAYGVQTEPTTVRIQRLLPGTIERVWAYMTESDLRRQWLAAGPMELRVGGEVELTWRNDELSAQIEQRPEGMSGEHSMKSQITRIDPPRLLAFGWNNGEVTFELEPQGGEVLLTVTHRRLPDRNNLVSVLEQVDPPALGVRGSDRLTVRAAASVLVAGPPRSTGGVGGLPSVETLQLDDPATRFKNTSS